MTVYLSVAGVIVRFNSTGSLYSTALTPPVIQSSLSTAETMLILPAAMYKRITFLDSLLCDSQGSKVILLHI